MRTLLMTGCMTALLLSSLSAAQTPDEPIATKSDDPSVPIEVFQGARAKQLTKPNFPHSEGLAGHDGWVRVSMMVAPDGKPYEIMISQSSGNKVMEKETLRVADKWTFEPATLNGQPLDSAHEILVNFYNCNDQAKGSKRSFITPYKSLYKAIAANDRVAGDAAMAAMHPENMYEDSRYGIAQYAYAHKWGTVAGEYAGLRRARAAADDGQNFLKDVYVDTLHSFITRAAAAKDYEEALIAWRQLKAAKPESWLLTELQPLIDGIEVLKKDDTEYSISGTLNDGTWSSNLLKKHFRAVVTTGHLSEIKLRCQKKYVFFAYDPALTYRVADSFGECLIQLVGDPGTKFSLIQS